MVHAALYLRPLQPLVCSELQHAAGHGAGPDPGEQQRHLGEPPKGAPEVGEPAETR